MTEAQIRRAVERVLGEVRRHSDDAADHLAILGAAISTVARHTTDPIGTANIMIEGLEGWKRVYGATTKAEKGPVQ